LKFDAIVAVTQQMTAAQNMLEESEEYFYLPAAFVNQRYYISRQRGLLPKENPGNYAVHAVSYTGPCAECDCLLEPFDSLHCADVQAFVRVS